MDTTSRTGLYGIASMVFTPSKQGSSAIDITEITVDAASFQGAEGSAIEIEDSDAPYAILGGETGLKVSTYAAGAVANFVGKSLNGSLVITTKAMGDFAAATITYASCTASGALTGNIGKNGFPQVQITFHSKAIPTIAAAVA